MRRRQVCSLKLPDAVQPSLAPTQSTPFCQTASRVRSSLVAMGGPKFGCPASGGTVVEVIGSDVVVLDTLVVADGTPVMAITSREGESLATTYWVVVELVDRTGEGRE